MDYRRNRDPQLRNLESNLNFTKMKRQLNRIKNGPLPNIPSDHKELRELFRNGEIIEKYGFSLDQISKFYVDTVVDEQHSFCIFQSAAIISFIEKNIEPCNRHYLLDGTFSCVPRGFYQLLVICIEYRNDVSLIGPLLVVLQS